MSLARKRGIVARRCFNAIALQLLSAPRNSNSDQGKRQGIDELWHRESGKGRNDKAAQQRAEAGRQQTWPETAEAGREQNRGHEKQVGRVGLQDRRERHTCNESDGYGERRHTVPKHVLAGQKLVFDTARPTGVAGFGVQMRKKRLHCRPVKLSFAAVSGTLGYISGIFPLWRPAAMFVKPSGSAYSNLPSALRRRWKRRSLHVHTAANNRRSYAR